MQTVVYYDLLNQPGPGFPWRTVLIILFALALGALLYAYTVISEDATYKDQKILGFLILAGIISLESFTHWTETQRQNECRAWLKNGDYQTVEGEITQFRQDSSKSPKWEAFQVENHAFNYSLAENKGCGFNQITHQGGPFEQGKWVRIAHHQGLILKIEIRP
jgi:hypothetical protein